MGTPLLREMWRRAKPAARFAPVALGQLLHWWPTLWPYVAGVVLGLTASAVAVFEAFPRGVHTALVGLGVFSATVWCAQAVQRNWTTLVRLVRRRGVSLTRQILIVNASKPMAGARRDLVTWGPVECRVRGAQLVGFNCSRYSISNVRITAHSLKTNQVFDGFLDGYPPNETYGVPGRCQFSVSVFFGNTTPNAQGGLSEGLTPEDFRDFVGSFEVVFEYDAHKKRVRFPYWISAARIEDAIDRLARPAPERPRVTKKE